MRLDCNLAEVTGAILGDGCLSGYWSSNEGRKRYEVVFTGCKDDYDYYEQFIQPCFVNSFGIKGRLFIRKDGSTRHHVKSRRVFEYFYSLGLPSGKKGRMISIPEKILLNKKFAVSCLRGLWNTDGSVYRRYSKKYCWHRKHYSTLLVLQMRLISKPLLVGVQYCLGRLSIKSNRIVDEGASFVLRITNQKEIEKFIDLVGFSNNHHLSRLKLFRTKTI